MKKVSLSEFLDSMEKNGYKQAFGKLITSKDGFPIRSVESIESACALGQGMANLNIMHLRALGHQDFFTAFVDRVAVLNDRDKLPPNEIAKILRREYKDKLNIKFQAFEYGDSDAPLTFNSLR